MCFSFYLRFTPCKAKEPLRGMKLPEKKKKFFKRQPKDKGSPLTLHLLTYLNHMLEESICRQIIPESSYARKETVAIDILITFRNSNREIMQSIRIKSGSLTRTRKRNQFSQFN